MCRTAAAATQYSVQRLVVNNFHVLCNSSDSGMIANIMVMILLVLLIIVEVGFFIVLGRGSGSRQRMKFVYCGADKQNSANIK